MLANSVFGSVVQQRLTESAPIPSNVLIGPDGTIVARNLMGHDLYNKLAELLDQPASSKQKQEKKIGLIVQANYRSHVETDSK